MDKLDALYSPILTTQYPVSHFFNSLGHETFIDAANWVNDLPYKRNSDKNDIHILLKEKQGTCSTKHATLKRLALENNIQDIHLMLGIFQMNAINTPAVKDVLQHYNVDYIPEAHNYLKLHNTILDFTGLASQEQTFEDVLLVEIEITPEQINTFKIDYHKQYLHSWLQRNSIPYTLEEIWTIRELCIEALFS